MFGVCVCVAYRDVFVYYSIITSIRGYIILVSVFVLQALLAAVFTRMICLVVYVVM